jgi:hypothetical protein
MSSKEVENFNKITYYIDSININEDNSHFIDSICIDKEPFDIIMEHGIIAIGVKHDNKKR